jgi:hypothetical protein
MFLSMGNTCDDAGTASPPALAGCTRPFARPAVPVERGPFVPGATGDAQAPSDNVLQPDLRGFAPAALRPEA